MNPKAACLSRDQVLDDQVITVGCHARALLDLSQVLMARIMSARATWGSWLRSPLLGT